MEPSLPDRSGLIDDPALASEAGASNAIANLMRDQRPERPWVPGFGRNSRDLGGHVLLPPANVTEGPGQTSRFCFHVVRPVMFCGSAFSLLGARLVVMGRT